MYFSIFSGRVYVAPKTLRKRKEIIDMADDRPVEANMDATGVELHKDSKFYESWQNFKVWPVYYCNCHFLIKKGISQLKTNCSKFKKINTIVTIQRFLIMLNNSGTNSSIRNVL